jgi:phosphatidylglycerol:prolipoprotein diacylglycerol transferase
MRLQTFGMALLLAYMAGLWLAARQARRHGIDSDHVYNVGLYALLAGIVTARLGHAIAYFEVYRVDPLQLLSLSPGAFLPLPGLIGALGMAAIYLYRHHLPAVRMLDILAPGLVLALAIAALGAFLAGRDLGTLSDLPWAVELFGVRRHPVALYQALALMLLLGLLLWVDRRAMLRTGQLALMALFGYATLRLFLEPLRAEGLLIGDGWRLTQIVALAALLASGWLLGHMAGANNQTRPPSEAEA